MLKGAYPEPPNSLMSRMISLPLPTRAKKTNNKQTNKNKPHAFGYWSFLRLFVSNEHPKCLLQKKENDHNKTYALTCQERFQRPTSS